MLNKTFTNPTIISESLNEERRLNALTLAVQLFSRGILVTPEDLVKTTESFYSYLETGW